MDMILEKVGTFLTAFNEVEANTYIVLNLLPNDELKEFALNLDRFEARVRFLQALLQNSDLENKDKYHELFNEALSLSKYRNQLSHNPLRVNYYQNTETEELTIKHEISNAKSGNTIPQAIGQLDTKIREVTKISSELFKLTSEYTIV